MAVKYASTAQKFFKRGAMMPGQAGYGNVKTSRLNGGGDMKWRGKRGKGMGKMQGGKSSSAMKTYGY